MTQYIKILLNLVLFQMIVSQGISQEKYIIQNKENVCYTLDENREIALIMIKGEKDSALNVSCNKYTKLLEKDFNQLNIQFNKCDSISTQTIKDNEFLNKELIKLKDKHKIYTYILTGSITANVIFLLIVIL